jgi:hypothetical protein
MRPRSDHASAISRSTRQKLGMTTSGKLKPFQRAVSSARNRADGQSTNARDRTLVDDSRTNARCVPLDYQAAAPAPAR